MRVLNNEQLAATGYDAEREARADILGHFPQELQGWTDLSTLDRVSRIAAAKAVRDVLMDDPDIADQMAEALGLQVRAEEKLAASRFREALDIAFKQMQVRSTAETAAWYTLRDWLREHPSETPKAGE